MADAPENPSDSPDAAATQIDDADTGLPFFRTWRGVYWFAAGSFVVYVILLAALPRLFA